MLDTVLARVVKPLFLFAVTFLSVRFLTGGNNTAGFVVGAIPLALGLANIFTRLGTAVTAICLLLVAATVILPPDVKKHVMAITSQVTNTAFQAVEHPNSLTNDAEANTAKPAKHKHASD